jgi:hypothetical protein
VSQRFLANLIIWLLPGGSIVQLVRAAWAYRECRKAAALNGLPYKFKWDVLRGPEWRLLHPASGHYCDICGADNYHGEPCDAGLHS